MSRITLQDVLNLSFQEELNRYNDRPVNTSEQNNVKNLFTKLKGIQKECVICYDKLNCLKCFQCDSYYCNDCFVKVISEYEHCSVCRTALKGFYNKLEQTNKKIIQDYNYNNGNNNGNNNSNNNSNNNGNKYNNLCKYLVTPQIQNISINDYCYDDDSEIELIASILNLSLEEAKIHDKLLDTQQNNTKNNIKNNIKNNNNTNDIETNGYYISYQNISKKCTIFHNIFTLVRLNDIEVDNIKLDSDFRSFLHFCITKTIQNKDAYYKTWNDYKTLIDTFCQNENTNNNNFQNKKKELMNKINFILNKTSEKYNL